MTKSARKKRFEQLEKEHMDYISELVSNSSRYKHNKNNKKTVNTYRNFLLYKLKKSSQILCLYRSNYCCEICGCTENLTIHHKVKKNCRESMSAFNYFHYRWFYENQEVVCIKCHLKLHNSRKNMLPIPIDVIEECKKLNSVMV